MTPQGKQGQGPYTNQPANPQGSKTNSSVFAGKPFSQPVYSTNNLAVQRSLMEIFDEFTVVISGELKSMNMETFETERKQPPQAD